MKNPTVSIIVTTKNEESVLKSLLISLKKQSYKPLEIVVVDNRSSDRTKEIAKRFTINVFDKGPERSAQRNFGASKSTGAYLLFLDADMKLSEDVVKECITLAGYNLNIGAIAIPEESVADKFWEKVKSFERSFYNEKGDSITDAARFFSRKAFINVNGYDETITGPEDWDLPERIKKAGYTIGRIKVKIYHHERVPNPFKLAKKKYYYALTSYRYLKKHEINPISAKTIYFLRPIFYKNWRRLIMHPILSVSMIFMLLIEQTLGGVGYLVGRIKKL